MSETSEQSSHPESRRHKWRDSERLNKLFRYCAWIVACMGVFMIAMLTPWFQRLEMIPTYEMILRVTGGVLGIVGTPASLVLLIGMAIFCVREDSSPGISKVLWFFLFLSTACFGAAVYFFLVYNRKKGTDGIIPFEFP